MQAGAFSEATTGPQPIRPMRARHESHRSDNRRASGQVACALGSAPIPRCRSKSIGHGDAGEAGHAAHALCPRRCRAAGPRCARLGGSPGARRGKTTAVDRRCDRSAPTFSCKPDAATPAELEKPLGGTDTASVDPPASERRLAIPEGSLPADRARVLGHGCVDAKGVLRKVLPGKAIVLAATGMKAEAAACPFDAEVAHPEPSAGMRDEGDAVSSRGADASADGTGKLRRVVEEPLRRILAGVSLLDIGFGAPEVVSLVFARCPQTAILCRQTGGRGSARRARDPCSRGSISPACRVATTTATTPTEAS